MAPWWVLFRFIFIPLGLSGTEEFYPARIRWVFDFRFNCGSTSPLAFLACCAGTVVTLFVILGESSVFRSSLCPVFESHPAQSLLMLAYFSSGCVGGEVTAFGLVSSLSSGGLAPCCPFQNEPGVQAFSYFGEVGCPFAPRLARLALCLLSSFARCRRL